MTQNSYKMHNLWIAAFNTLKKTKSRVKVKANFPVQRESTASPCDARIPSSSNEYAASTAASWLLTDSKEAKHIVECEWYWMEIHLTVAWQDGCARFRPWNLADPAALQD